MLSYEQYRAIAALSLLAGCSLTFFGCASSAKPAAMVPERLPAVRQTGSSVSTKVLGGEQTNPMWMSKISSEDFRIALDQALIDSGLFGEVVLVNAAEYRLEVFLLSVDQPALGLDMTVKLKARWRLTRAGENNSLWEQVIATAYKAKFGESVVAVTRLRKANEGAARENIAEGLRRLSQADF